MAASDAASDAGEPPILRLRPHDADGVSPLSVEAGWNQIDADWRLMIAAGSAFGIKDGAGRWIATALALPLGTSGLLGQHGAGDEAGTPQGPWHAAPAALH